MKVEIYSDIACPWCHLGRHRFERALAAFPGAADVEVVYRPYQLVPDAPETPVPHPEYMAGRFGPQAVAMDARLTEVGAAEGVVFDFARAVETNTLLAHRLLWLARHEYGAAAQAALKDRLLTAHFAEGADVGDRGQLTAIAVGAGLERGRVAAFLEGDEGRAEVLAEIAHAREIGVTAVPTFVFEGKWAVQGAQEVPAFLRALEQAAGAAAGAAAGESPEGAAVSS